MFSLFRVDYHRSQSKLGNSCTLRKNKFMFVLLVWFEMFVPNDLQNFESLRKLRNMVEL